jgi:CheY-like chemotaxis protein
MTSPKPPKSSAIELERRDLQATEESRKAAEEARRIAEEARLAIDARMREYLDELERADAIDCDDSSIRRLYESMNRPPSSRPEKPISEAPPTPRRGSLDTIPRSERVIIVDDDRETVDVLAALLRDEGYAVRTAADGIEALGKILKDFPPPDVILLDLGLPYLSGDGVLAALQTTGLAELPVLIISTAESHYIPTSMRQRYVFVERPIDVAGLLSNVRTHIAEWRARPRS